MNARAVLFDMDGTLVDSEGLHFNAMSKALFEMGYQLPDGFGERITGMSGADTYALLRDAVGFKPSLADYIDGKYRNYLAAADNLKRRPGADDALEYLSRRDTPFAIVSNSDRILVDANLRSAHLQRPGIVSVSRNDVRQGKPHPEGYLRAAYLLGVVPNECVVVEDSAPGAAAGLAAGMTVIGWPEPHRPDIAFPQGVILAGPENLTSTLGHVLAPSFQDRLSKDIPDVSRQV